MSMRIDGQMGPINESHWLRNLMKRNDRRWPSQKTPHSKLKKQLVPHREHSLR